MPRHDPIGVAVGGDHDIARSDPAMAACRAGSRGDRNRVRTDAARVDVGHSDARVDRHAGGLGSATKAIDEHGGVGQTGGARRHPAVERIGGDIAAFVAGLDQRHPGTLAAVAVLLVLLLELAEGRLRTSGDETAAVLERAGCVLVDEVLEMDIGLVGLVKDRSRPIGPDVRLEIDHLGDSGPARDESGIAPRRTLADTPDVQHGDGTTGECQLGGTAQSGVATTHDDHVGARRRIGVVRHRWSVTPPPGVLGKPVGEQGGGGSHRRTLDRASHSIPEDSIPPRRCRPPAASAARFPLCLPLLNSRLRLSSAAPTSALSTTSPDIPRGLRARWRWPTA